MAAEAFVKTKRFLRVANIDVEVRDIRVSPIKPGSKSTLQDIYVSLSIELSLQIFLVSIGAFFLIKRKKNTLRRLPDEKVCQVFWC